uniref:Tensin 2a n=1 Tax=Hucho hucho TaxID=62062 RepID=A0A4W5JDL3_9TELE
VILHLISFSTSSHSPTALPLAISLIRSISVDRVMERVMERHYDFDLTYITEGIISVFFPPLLDEQRYRLNLKEVTAMLRSKHQDKFLLFNLSERHHDITRMNPKVLDFGWPDFHAPPLDKICAMCKAMETWLTSDPQHVVVLHCKGNKGKTGVIIAAYMHYSKISAGGNRLVLWLKPAAFMYIYYFGGLLSGAIKMNSSPLFLHQVLIPTLPNFQGKGGYFPFLKLYQSMQLVYTSGIYDLQGSVGRRLCVTIEPALLLKGDIMVKCYHRRAQGAERDTVFRLQFHTCTIHGAQLWFGKGELDEACTDERFPSDATVEFVFSSGPEKMKGSEYQRNDPVVTVDYNTADPVVRWDSYENFNQPYQDRLHDIAHTRGPVDGSLYAQIKKRLSAPGSGSLTSNGCPAGTSQERPSQSQLLSPSSDSLTHSGHSSALPEHPEESRGLPPPTRQEREDLDRLLGGIEGERDGLDRERETAILDDGDSSSPSERTGTLRLDRSCSCRVGYHSQRCAEPGCDRLHLMSSGYCRDRAPGTNGHPGSPPLANPATVPSHMDLCQHYSPHPHPHQALPPPDLVWNRQQGPPHYLHHEGPSRHPSLCPYPSQDLTSHPHTLHPGRLLYGRGMSENVSWRDHISQGSFKRMHPSRDVPCSTPSDLSRPPTPPPVPGFATLGRRLMLVTEPPGPLQHYPGMESSTSGHSPAPEVHTTPTFPTSATGCNPQSVPHVPYSSYTAVTIPQRPLPEKRGQSAQPGSPNCGVRTLRPTPSQHHVTFSPTVGEMVPPAGQGEGVLSLESEMAGRVSVTFVQDNSRFWYKPGISRDQAIAALKEREPGAFLIRDSNSFQGAYGLALKVATPPANLNNHMVDPLEQLVRHFLIETGPRGVNIKGCQNEPHFGSLSALVYQHSITPISLPCSLRIPEKGQQVFGFVAKKPGSMAENVCHLFAELDPEQPASAIVNFINKVMLGPQRR